MAAPGQDLPVVVIGAGPTGLAAALELARNGRAVRIVDKNPTRSQHSKAIGVNARTLELMEALRCQSTPTPRLRQVR
jgi:3-(3-hydroxy-phenyl)propionate hydroxylase